MGAHCRKLSVANLTPTEIHLSQKPLFKQQIEWKIEWFFL